jgi:hypothetical protein
MLLELLEELEESTELELLEPTELELEDEELIELTELLDEEE